jgi:hypothetical protein
VSFTAKIVELASYDVYLALFLIAAVIIAIALIVLSSDEYSVKKTEENSEEFAGEIRDSKGPVTKWLWVAYLVLIIWAIAYLAQHWSEFAVFP